MDEPRDEPRDEPKDAAPTPTTTPRRPGDRRVEIGSPEWQERCLRLVARLFAPLPGEADGLGRAQPGGLGGDQQGQGGA
jgi:hypothetical protein